MPAVRTIRTHADLDELSSQWNELVQRSPRPAVFMTWEWLRNWTAEYVPDGRLLVLAAYDDSRLIGVAPFWREQFRVSGLPSLWRLRFLASAVADYHDIIIDRKRATEAISAICRELFGPLRRDWDVLNYADVPSQSRALHLFYSLAPTEPRCAAALIDSFSVCPYVPLPSDWEEFVETLSHNQRKALKRSLRLLSEAGSLEFRTVTEPDRVTEELDRLIRLNRSVWQERGLPGSFHDEASVRFHHRLAQSMAERGELFLGSLWLDDTHLASAYGYEYDGVLYFYVIAVGTSPVPKAGIGRALIGLSIKHAIENGCREFDQLRGDEAYKYDWTNKDRRILSVIFFNGRIRTFIYLLLRTGKDYIKRLLKAMVGKRPGNSTPIGAAARRTKA